MLLLDAEELFERGRLAVENGLSMAVHAIGDRANHEVLDAICSSFAIRALTPDTRTCATASNTSR